MRHKMRGGPLWHARRLSSKDDLVCLRDANSFLTLLIRLSPVRFDDEDFLVLGGVADESDGLPTGTARQYWSAEALEREDREIARYEAMARDQVHAACRNIVARFKEQPSASV